MPRATLSLGDPSGQSATKSQWKFARGYVPGEPNEGLLEQSTGSPARLPGYDDSNLGGMLRPHRPPVPRIHLRLVPHQRHPPRLRGRPPPSRASASLLETCIDDYGEIWIDGECNRERGAIQGFNVPQRVVVTDSAVPGAQHTIALLAVNGPLGAPFGTIFVRYATLAFEWVGA